MMENTSYDDLLSPDNTNTTFIQHLAATDGLADNYFGVTHDSLPNYIAATSGQTWGSNSDDTAQAPLFDHQNLVDQLVAAHDTDEGRTIVVPTHHGAIGNPILWDRRFFPEIAALVGDGDGYHDWDALL